jgi:hypothetical protein
MIFLYLVADSDPSACRSSFLFLHAFAHVPSRFGRWLVCFGLRHSTSPTSSPPPILID